MGIAVAGIASGIDSDSIISQLLALKNSESSKFSGALPSRKKSESPSTTSRAD